MKHPLVVHYTVMIDEKTLERLYKEGKAHGNAYGDSGPELTAKRYLMDEGLSGCFREEYGLGLEFELRLTEK